MSALNAEPLLLHLLILSGYTGERWEEAAANRTLVYEEIFRKIYQRDQAKEHTVASQLDVGDYFTLLECLGLAAWRGNGRTGADGDFQEVRKLHATSKQEEIFKKLKAAKHENVAILFHTRKDEGGEGYEFIHKSFGEYLTARALLSEGMEAARLMSKEDDPYDCPVIAEKWTRLIDRADLTEEILGFLFDSARRVAAENTKAALDPLAKLFGWTLAHGMPAHKAAPDADYRTIETMQRCAESALLAVIDALSRHRFAEGIAKSRSIACKWPKSARDPVFLFERLKATSQYPVRLVIGCLPLQEADLRGVDLSLADLSGAELSSAKLNLAKLAEADLSNTNLTGAQLLRSYMPNACLIGADLMRADFAGSDLTKADLSFSDLSGGKLQWNEFDRCGSAGCEITQY